MTTDALAPLQDGEALDFADWPGDPPIPLAIRGVYTIWRSDQLLYVGIAGLGELPTKKPKKPWGLHRRLGAHAAGRRARDQFSVYIGDRFVLDAVDEDVLDDIVAGEQSMDALVKAWVHEHLSYRYLEVEASAVARDLEQRVRRGQLDAGPPMLNPLRTKTPVP